MSSYQAYSLNDPGAALPWLTGEAEAAANIRPGEEHAGEVAHSDDDAKEAVRGDEPAVAHVKEEAAANDEDDGASARAAVGVAWS